MNDMEDKMGENNKVKWLQDNGIELYINSFQPDVTVLELLQDDGAKKDSFKVCGRAMFKRAFKKTVFISLNQDFKNVQVLIKQENVDSDSWNLIAHGVGVGDVLGISGKMGFSDSQELSVIASSLTLVSKSIRQWPEKRVGLKNIESIYRKRYLSLQADPRSIKIFQVRFKAISSMRRYLSDRGFIEVETPILHNVASGASAEPFKTYHNKLDMNLFLRISPELYLKKLQVGGMGKVFEINRSFRNEGISVRHNPEFTMMECYEAYRTCRDAMNTAEGIIRKIILDLNIECEILNKPFKRVPMLKLTADFLHLKESDMHRRECLDEICHKHSLEDAPKSIGAMQEFIFEELVSSNLKEPTFVTNYPEEGSPLAVAKDGFADRAELYVNGMELANMYSELNDPEKQRANFINQSPEHADFSFVEALEYGMPPCTGLGIGIDRLVMILTNSQCIRDVILFPAMKPKN